MSTIYDDSFTLDSFKKKINNILYSSSFILFRNYIFFTFYKKKNTIALIATGFGELQIPIVRKIGTKCN